MMVGNGPQGRVCGQVATTIAVVAALAAGFCFAVGSIMQQGVARQSAEEVLRFALLWHLVRQPRWVAGVALEAFSFVVQGVALVFGLGDALTKSTVDLFSNIGWTTLVQWEPYALAATGVVSALFGQSAFGAGALSLSLPVIDTLEPVCAVVIGATIFGEQLASSPLDLGFQLAGGAAAGVGVAVLSSSKIVEAETLDTPEPAQRS